MFYILKRTNGYVVLPADKRIEGALLADVEDGALDSTDFDYVRNDDYQRPYYANYPETGPGIFTIPKYPRDEFMNPNTVDFADNEVNDTLVGDFVEAPTSPSLNVDDSRIEQAFNQIFIADLLYQFGATYMNKSASDFGIDDDRGLPSVIHTTNTENHDAFIEGGTFSITYTEWRTETSKSPILSQYVHWQQGQFQQLCPIVRRFWLFGQTKNGLPGCFPLAISKIVAKYRYPRTYSFNGHRIDWDKVDEYFDYQRDIPETAYLAAGIASSCKSKYFWQGTFTFPKDAEKAMKNMGYRVIGRYNYSWERCKMMLEKDSPLIIWSMPNYNITKSHAWNIDGYKVRIREKVTQLGSRKQTETQRQYLVHCDFGWGGKSNGYYLSGIFKLTEETELDGTYMDINYNKHLRLMLYDSPDQY